MTQLRKGRQKKAYFGLVYGMPGSGKTSLLSNRPKNFFIGTEPNAEFDIVGYSPAKTYRELLEQLENIEKDLIDAKCDTVVIDHISDIERLCKEDFCGKQNLASYGNGYGQGYQELEKRMFYFLDHVKRLQSKGYNVVLVGHADEKNIVDITTGAERLAFRPQLEKKTLNLISAATDFIFHIHKRTSEKDKGLSKPTRVLYTSYFESIFAKKRGSMEIPDEITIEENDTTMWEKIHGKMLETFSNDKKK